jgi:hypothetical protein
MINMKTLVVCLLIGATSFSRAMALTENRSKGEKELAKKGDSSEVVELKFEMSLDVLRDVLTVELDGTFDQYSSVSVTNNRGSEYFFEFVKNGSNKLYFDLTKLEKGSYYLVLNTDKEIRIKRFVIE